MYKNPNIFVHGKATQFNTQNAKAMQKKGAEVKNYKRATIEQAGKVFGPYAPEAFKALSEAAAKGDIPALEQMRKWIFGEEDLKQNAGTNIVIQVGKEEALAIDKWSKK